MANSNNQRVLNARKEGRRRCSDLKANVKMLPVSFSDPDRIDNGDCAIDEFAILTETKGDKPRLRQSEERRWLLAVLL